MKALYPSYLVFSKLNEHHSANFKQIPERKNVKTGNGQVKREVKRVVWVCPTLPLSSCEPRIRIHLREPGFSPLVKGEDALGLWPF